MVRSNHHHITHSVERRLEAGKYARLKRRRYKNVNSRSYFLLFRDSSTYIPCVAPVRSRHSCVVQRRDTIGIRWYREVTCICSEHVHADAAFEFLGISNIVSTDTLACDGQTHKELSLGLDMNLPGWIFAIVSSVVGASTCIALVPATWNFLGIHTMSFNANRAD